MTQIIIPISSESPFFKEEEYYFPKPLVTVNGDPLIIQVIKNIQNYIIPHKFIFIIPESLDTKYSLGSAIKLVCNCKVDIILRKGKTSGGLCSSLLAIDHISNNHDMIFSNMDDLIDYDLEKIIKDFRKSNADAGLISFKSSHPRWSYIKEGPNGKVVHNIEKKVESKLAAAGFYYFKEKKLFVEAASSALLDEDTVNGLYYLSSAINQLILKGCNVIHKEIPSNKYHSLYSPDSIKEYENYLNSKKINDSSQFINIVIPAAGEGSRFSKEGWKTPKPFIDVNGSSMIEKVIDNLYIENSRNILIFNKKHLNGNQLDKKSQLSQNNEVVVLEKTTDGTACTVLNAKKFINNKSPLLIANSDQIVDFSCQEFISDCLSRDLDGSILVFKDPHMDAKWSFIKTNHQGLVTEVAEKKPISNLATVGIYFFKEGISFVEEAFNMILSKDTVNNEFYTCPVYNYMIKSGLKIGFYEIPYVNMYGIGTPQDLRNYLKKNSFPISKDDPEI